MENVNIAAGVPSGPPCSSAEVVSGALPLHSLETLWVVQGYFDVRSYSETWTRVLKCLQLSCHCYKICVGVVQ
jgi:hypothetical protein